MCPDSGAMGDRGSCCSNNHTPLRGEQQATILWSAVLLGSDPMKY